MTGQVRKKFWLFAASAAAALVANGQAVAQEEAVQGDEIIVTATKRETALQDVPIAVTPVTAELIENSGIRDLQDVQSVAPSLQFNVSENEASATARLRGIGTQGSNPGLESAVGIFVDGVYRARNGVALSDLGQVSQIEVLRGPQGTLFGRNTSAGLINVRSAGPDLDEFGASAEATAGNLGSQRFAGHVNVPIVSEQLAVRLFAAMDERDGLIDINRAGANPALAAGAGNQGAGASNNRDMWTVRGHVAWAPTNDIDVRLIADYTERDEACCAAKVYNPTLLNGYPTLRSNHNVIGVTATSGVAQDPFQPTNPGVSSPGQAAVIAALGGYGTGGLANLGSGDIGDRYGFANRSYGQNLTDQGVSAEVNWDIGGITLSSITAFRNWDYRQGQDSDFSQADLYYRVNDGFNGFSFDVFTQEVRAAFAVGPVDSIVGVFYSDETLTRGDNIQFGSQIGEYVNALSAIYAGVNQGDAVETAFENSPISDHYVQDSRSIALFTHNIWSIDDKTDLTVGLRYTDEEKDVTGRFTTRFNARPLLQATIAGATGSAPLGALYGNCYNTDLTTAGAGAAAVIGARTIYCISGINASLDGAPKTQSRSEKEWSGVVSLRREFTDDVSGYSSYSRGYKGGGFNLDRNFDHMLSGSATPAAGSWKTDFAAEMVDAFEIGLKNQLLDNALIINLAAFFNKYENYQLNTFNGTAFQVSSVPEVTSQGVEMDAIWNTPIDGFSYQGGFAYTEAEYGNDTGWVATSANPLNPTQLPVNFRLPGSRLTNAPLWTVTSAFTYEKPLFNDAMVGLAYLDFRYVSDQVTGSDLDPTKVQPGYFTVNGRVGLSTASDRVSLELWGRNLFDEQYQQISFNVPLQGNARGAFLGDPRTYGVTLRVSY
ncbi:MAG: TonB-dependent receptor [Alphaproteobacteria bacterium]|nr:TonB-dependent receptor [Alphaproteobacteria bacterium]